MNNDQFNQSMSSDLQFLRSFNRDQLPRPGSESVSDDYYSFSFSDTALGIPRGVLEFGSDLTNLVLLPTGLEVPDRFNLLDPASTIGGDISGGIANFATGFFPFVGVAGKLGKIGKIGQITTAMDKSIAASITAANLARKAGDLNKAVQLGRKAARLGGIKELTRVTTASALTDFVGFDGHAARFSSLLQEYGGLNDPVTSWLAAEDDDSVIGELTGRLKNAIEGVGLGLIADGLFTGLKIYKAGLKAKSKGLDPTPFMVKEARSIRVAQEAELRDAFNLKDDEARVANILIDRMGIDRSRLRIASGDDALNIYNDATGELLEQVSLRAAPGRKFDVRTTLVKLYGEEGAAAHPLMNLETPELLDSINSLGGIRKAEKAYEQVSTIYDTLIAFAKAGAPLHGGYEEGVVSMTKISGKSRMQLWGLFSAATSPQNIVRAHTELGVYLMIKAGEDAIAGRVTPRAKLATFIKKLLKEEIGYTGAPSSGYVSGVEKIYNEVIDRFQKAKSLARSDKRFASMTDEDIFRTLDFEDLVPSLGTSPNSMKIRGFGGGSIGSKRLNLALDTWMARLLPDDFVTPTFKNRKKTVNGKTVRVKAMETMLEAKKTWMSQKENFVGYSAVISEVAKRLGFSQTQVQERIWGAVVMFTALKREGVPLDFMFNQLSRQDMKTVWDLMSIISDPRITNELRKIAHPKTEALLKDVGSVFATIRKSIFRGKSNITSVPNLSTFSAAEIEGLQSGIRTIGIGAGSGAHQEIIRYRLKNNRTWDGPKFDWKASFRRETSKYYESRGLAAPGTVLRSEVGDQVLGFARFADDAVTIGGLRGANFETAVHELGHVARRFVFDPSVPESIRYGVTSADIESVAKFFGASRDRTGKMIWSIESEEAFTESLIRYLKTDNPPVPGFGAVFHKLKMFLRNLVNDVSDVGALDGLPTDVKKAFDNLLNRGPADDIAGVTFGRALPTGSMLLKSAVSTSGATDNFPGGVPHGPFPASLGRPSGVPGDMGNPWGKANWDKFSTDRDVSNYVKELADDYTQIDQYVPQSRKEVLAMAQDDYNRLNDIIGERSSTNIEEVLGDMGTGDLRKITYRLTAMRQLAADMGARIYDIAAKGKMASSDELYEFIRGRRLVESMLYEIREQQRHIARALNFQGISMKPNASRPKLFPVLPKQLDNTIPPGVERPSRSGSLSTGQREAVPSSIKIPPKGTDEALEAVGKPVATSVQPEAAGPAVVPAALTAEREALFTNKVVEDAIQGAGGRAAVLAEMNKVVAAASTGGIDAVPTLIRKTAKWGQAVMEYWMNSILSGPVTHAVNLTSNTLVTLLMPVERAVGSVLRGDFAYAASNLKTYLHAVNNFGDALKLASISFAKDENILEAGFRKSEIEGRAISSQGLGMREDSIVGMATNWVGKVLNLPTRFLSAEDEFFKQLNYRARFKTELQIEGLKRHPGDYQSAAQWAEETFERLIEDGQAYTEAVVLKRAHEKASSLGIADPNRRAAFIRKYMSNKKNWDPELGALSRQAVDESRYATFTNPLEPDSGSAASRIGAAFQAMTLQVPAIRFLAPFIRTPTNLLNFAMARTPIVNTKYIRELYSSASREAANPARRSDIAGRLAFSVAIGYTAIAAATSGVITGGGPKERDRREMWEATGWRPYSIKIGDKYVSYRRFDPFSTVLGLFADSIETYSEIQANGGDVSSIDNIMQILVVSLSRNITNKTYMTGLTNFMNAVSNPKQFGRRLVNSYAGASVPFSSLMGQSVGVFAEEDPVHRELYTALDAIKARIPGLEETVPPRRNLFGEPIDKPKRGLVGAAGLVSEENPIYSAMSNFSPFEYSQSVSDELASEFRKLNHPFDRPNPVRGRNMDLREFQTDNGQQAYDRWLQLHGEVKIRKVTLRKALLRLIRSREYQRMSPISTEDYQSPRVRMIRTIISRYRAAAFSQLLKESSKLKEFHKVDFANRQALLSGRRADELLPLIR